MLLFFKILSICKWKEALIKGINNKLTEYVQMLTGHNSKEINKASNQKATLQQLEVNGNKRSKEEY